MLARLDGDTHYQLLGLGMSATSRDLDAAYLERVRPYHPDEHVGTRLADYEDRLRKVFTRLAYAHQLLSTPVRRREYDEYLAVQEANRCLEAAMGASIATGELPPVRPPRAVSSAPSAPSVPPAPGSGAPLSKRPPLDDLRRALSSGRNPREPRQPYIVAAEQAFAEGHWVSALNAARVALAVEPDNASLRALHDAAAAKASGDLVAPYRSRAAYEEGKQDWEAAAKSYERVAEGTPGDAEPLAKAAECLLRAGTDARGAVRVARAAVAVAPQAPSHRITLARAYEAAGLIESALGELGRAAALAPNDTTIASWIARLRAVRT